MGLESLLDRLESQPVTAVTAAVTPAVTLKPAPALARTAVTAVTAQNSNTGANERPAPAIWCCRVDGQEFTVIDPAKASEAAMLQGLRERFGARLQYAHRLR